MIITVLGVDGKTRTVEIPVIVAAHPKADDHPGRECGPVKVCCNEVTNGTSRT